MLSWVGDTNGGDDAGRLPPACAPPAGLSAAAGVRAKEKLRVRRGEKTAGVAPPTGPSPCVTPVAPFFRGVDGAWLFADGGVGLASLAGDNAKVSPLAGGATLLPGGGAELAPPAGDPTSVSALAGGETSTSSFADGWTTASLFKGELTLASLLAGGETWESRLAGGGASGTASLDTAGTESLLGAGGAPKDGTVADIARFGISWA